MQRISTHGPPRGLLQELTSQKVPKSIKSKLTINIFCINGQSAIWIPYGDPGLHTWRPIRRSRHLCSPAPVAGIDNQYVFCGALNKASHIAPSGVPPVLAQLCSLNSFFICSISGNSRATALQVLSLAQLWRNSGATLAQLCSLNSFLICSISGSSCATALQVLSFLRLLLSQPLSSNCSFRFLMCNCTLTFTCVPLHSQICLLLSMGECFFLSVPMHFSTHFFT